MSEAREEHELSAWMSTYGIITSERLLERYNIRLNHQELYTALKNPNSYYHLLLEVPLKNVFNGIILQQAYDYEIYAQKLFIDYLISGESAKPDESPGGYTREQLEEERKKLVAMASDFRDCEMDHKRLIADSQKVLIDKAKHWLDALASIVSIIKAKVSDFSNEQIKQIVNALVVHPEFTDASTINLKGKLWERPEKIYGQSLSTELKQIFANETMKLKALNVEVEDALSEFSAKAQGMGINVRTWRTDFHDLILRVNDLIYSLPEYNTNKTQAEENKESLFFDAEIGESKK